jgi:hypothetical protein
LGKTTVAVIIILFLVIVGGITYSYYLTPPKLQPPTNLTFALNFPKIIVAGYTGTANVSVVNQGADASGVMPIIQCDAISTSSSPVDLKHGSSVMIPITISGKDVADGSYALVVYLQYSSGLGSNRTASQGTSIYLLPNVQLTSVRYRSEFPYHLLPPYKDTIGKYDNTTLLFKVQSMSSSVIYSGMTVSAKLQTPPNVQGLSISPTSLAIEPIGPKGTTSEYGFVVISNGAPPGVYVWQILLYSKDNQLIMPQSLQITVTG